MIQGKLKINFRDDLIFYIISFSQACLYIYFTRNNSSSIFARYTLAMLLVGLLMIINNIYIKKVRVDSLSKFVILIFIYELFVSFFTGTFNSANLLYISSWKICFLVSSTSGRKDDCYVETRITNIMIVILLYISITRVQLSTDYHSNLTGIASLYVLLSFFPFVLRSKNNVFRFIYIIVTCVILAVSQKRAGFLAMIISCFLYIYFNYLIDGQKGLKRLYWFVVLLAISSFAYYLFSNSSIPIIDRLEELSSDGGHGRTRIWGIVFQEVQSANVINLFFGHGVHSSVLLLGRYVHNDFLQILYDFGLVGFALYFGFVGSLLYNIYIMKKYCMKSRSAYIAACAILLIICNTSIMLVRADISNLLMFFFGYQIHMICVEKQLCED